MANSLPFTPGGLGIGEAAFANAALALEPVRSGAPYATAFLAYRCTGDTCDAAGAFLGIPSCRRARTPREAVKDGARKRPGHESRNPGHRANPPWRRSSSRPWHSARDPGG